MEGDCFSPSLTTSLDRKLRRLDLAMIDIYLSPEWNDFFLMTFQCTLLLSNTYDYKSRPGEMPV